MNQDMKPEFLFLTDLPYVLTIVLQLQYIVELSGQQLLPVNIPLDNNTPTISEHLQLLRDRAHTWFKLNTQPVEHVDVSNKYIMKITAISNGHFCLMDDPTLHHDYLRGQTISEIFPILQEPSQQVFDRVWHSDTLSSVPNAHLNDILMDPTQNLLTATYHVLDGPDVYIDLLPLDRNGAHPQAAGPTLFISPELCEPQNVIPKAEGWRVCSLGRLMALSHSLRLNDPDRILWSLQIWDWQHSTMSNSVLSSAVSGSQISYGYCFLRTSRLLMIANINLKVYSIEDMSQVPQLLACFLLPAAVRGTHFVSDNSKDNGAQSRPEPGMPQKMWKSDPTHRIISLNMSPYLHFVISSRIFFDPDFINGGSTAIPWEHWGPLNTRIFQHCEDIVDSVTGSRVLKVKRALSYHNDPLEYSLRVMDFSPLAIKYGQGLGRLVREPSTIDLDGRSLTTSLPYVEVVSSKISSSLYELLLSSIDENRIYAFHVEDCFVKVIKLWEGV
ncbi:uncharacterized protein F5147DRAFT_813327 [Suillus discolor]|uniref:Uncharacterized protein n=1 Tax=Suillus discolor TaxID=1912936 RepID=A0A9P7F104_9AGAM|nr:uncharacterized protein F5147DRAFT_813327 [Suillus discolor]KAG2100153.1 hypothetical protein F5147DRAFT_813327 [Suillus discolor]